MTSSGLWLNEKQHFQTNFMKTRTQHLPGCHPWRNCFSSLCVASTIVIVLLATSCKSTKKISNINAIDSLTWSRHFSVTPEIIPPSLATLAVPMDSLRRLPAGASYTQRDGQATVNLSYQEGNVVASARCDSLQRLVFELSEQLYGKREQTEQREEQKTAPAATFWQRFKGYSSGVLTGIILTIIIQIIYKQWQKTRKQDQSA